MFLIEWNFAEWEIFNPNEEHPFVFTPLVGETGPALPRKSRQAILVTLQFD